MIDVVVVTEDGDVVQRLEADARALLIAFETAWRPSYGMLRDIDPYGNTVFNRVQMATFLSQWQRLVQDTGLADLPAARAVAKMAKFVSPHYS